MTIAGGAGRAGGAGAGAGPADCGGAGAVAEIGIGDGSGLGRKRWFSSGGSPAYTVPLTAATGRLAATSECAASLCARRVAAVAVLMTATRTMPPIHEKTRMARGRV